VRSLVSVAESEYWCKQRIGDFHTEALYKSSLYLLTYLLTLFPYFSPLDVYASDNVIQLSTKIAAPGDVRTAVCRRNVDTIFL